MTSFIVKGPTFFVCAKEGFNLKQIQSSIGKDLQQFLMKYCKITGSENRSFCGDTSHIYLYFIKLFNY